MNHKIYYLGICILMTGCGVELRDKNPPAPAAQELVVGKEFRFPASKLKDQMTVYKYDRLVLQSGSVLNTQGGNIRLEIKELVADDAVIRTFEPEAKAPQGSAGRSGGRLEVVAESAHGRLTIEMRGEQGGDGIHGRDPDESLTGGKGASGQDSVWKQGPTDLFPTCIQKAESGGTGGPGKRGFPGGPGWPGGGTGVLAFKTSSTEREFELKVVKIPGDGGIGGGGARGGSGGIGGDPGSVFWMKKPETKLACEANRNSPNFQGPPGPSGPDGATGDKGAPGESEKACWQLGVEDPTCD